MNKSDIKNSKLEFNQLPNSERSAFIGEGSKLRIEKDTLLYRFAMAMDPSRPIEWWSKVGDLKGILESAKKSNQPFHEFIRKRSAVFKQWNSMNGLLIIRLKHHIYGFEGGIAPQQLGKKYLNKKGEPILGKFYSKPAFLGGGFNQVLIKGLTTDDFDVIVPLGAISINDSAEEILKTLTGYHIIT